ncbi:MAG: 16S rRNA (cytosine(1402)-N(4))-methyltransferase RsmH [Desulfobacteraceae bacterium]|nr:MAG: 16S rRNA (cytosine(1402)-N(4))-methyltransferase RsmH [Desulfobacteraceae bacterium]
MKYPHRPVLVGEVLRFLLTDLEGTYVDGTAGSGGHSEALAARLGPKGRLICLDRDTEAVRLSKERLSSFGERVTVLKGNFSDLRGILESLGQETVDGILLDLGLSTFQLDHSGRGFSFSRDENLDMRMDQDGGMTAGDLLNTLPLKELETILKRYGEERKAKRIAALVEKERRSGGIRSSLQLARLVESAVPRSRKPGAKNPATRTFQAIRIAVNRELENLDAFLKDAPFLVRKEGRVAILSYHSLEDRMVKQTMVRWEKGCTCPRELPRCACGKNPLFRRLNKKGIKPTEEEIAQNPRSRSAVLRAAERV